MGLATLDYFRAFLHPLRQTIVRVDLFKMASTTSVDILESNEDDEEMETAGQIYKRLTTAWVNEKNCPDLLKTQNDLVECMMDQIKQMEENLKGLSNDDFLVIPHKMEIDRIRYVISSYLRVRLEKIENYAVFFLKRDRAIPNEDDRFMSKAEFAFAEKYSESVRNHFRAELSKYVPVDVEEFQNLDVEVRPDMMSLVSLKMLKPVDGILINGEPQNLEMDASHFIPFKVAKVLLDKGLAVCI